MTSLVKFNGDTVVGVPAVMADGTNGTLPAVTLLDSSGAATPSGSSTSPLVTQVQGSASIATSQAASSLSPATASLIVAARTGRRSVTIANVTGAQDVYLGPSGVTVSTGLLLLGTKGAAVTINTAAAIYATSPTAAQTLGVLEAY